MRRNGTECCDTEGAFCDRKWYRFYKMEADHDRFADINYGWFLLLGLVIGLRI
jgi:hypothetical protein